MSFNFNDLLNNAKGLVNKAGEKANEVADIAKNQYKKMELESKLDRKYSDLGRTYYNLQKTGIESSGNMKLLINEITDLEANLENLINNGEQTNFTNTENNFTNNENTQYEEAVNDIKEEKVQPNVSAPQEKNEYGFIQCAMCGTLNKPGNLYCNGCGAQIKRK